MNDGNILPESGTTEDQDRRFWHDDLGELSAEQVWAERAVLTAALAEMIFLGRRPRIIWTSATNQVTDQGWIRERLRKLTKERRAAA